MAPSASLLLLLLLGLAQALPLLEDKDHDGVDDGGDNGGDGGDKDGGEEGGDGGDKDGSDEGGDGGDKDGSDEGGDGGDKDGGDDGDDDGDDDGNSDEDSDKDDDGDDDGNSDKDSDGDDDGDSDGDNGGDDDGDKDQQGYNDEEIKEDHVDITHRILTANNASDRMLVEGDMLAPKTRNAMKCFYNSCLWKKGANNLVNIPYVIGNEFGVAERMVIDFAMKGFSAKTCIRFVPRTREADYIMFVSKIGCYSSLGRVGGMQELSLNRVGCMHSGIAMHEMNHALGFQHEQTRSDRDQYVRINWQNIMPTTGYNFDKHDTNNLNTPYDYSSLMHYGKDAFSIAYGKDTITPIPNPNVPIGQRNGLSRWDVTRIKMLYGC